MMAKGVPREDLLVLFLTLALHTSDRALFYDDAVPGGAELPCGWLGRVHADGSLSVKATFLRAVLKLWDVGDPDELVSSWTTPRGPLKLFAGGRGGVATTIAGRNVWCARFTRETCAAVEVSVQ